MTPTPQPQHLPVLYLYLMGQLNTELRNSQPDKQQALQCSSTGNIVVAGQAPTKPQRQLTA